MAQAIKSTGRKKVSSRPRRRIPAAQSSARKKSASPSRRPKAQDSSVSALKDIRRDLGRMREEEVKAAKYTHPELFRVRKGLAQDLPQGYGIDKIVLQVRDPWWLQSYWELGGSALERIKAELNDLFHTASWCLRVYDVTDIAFNGSNANRYFDINIPDSARNWYIDTASPGRWWCVDLGLLLADGRFITLLRSNVVQTPPDGPSWISDEEWMIPDELFAQLYGLGFGFGKSSPGAAWRQQMKEWLSSGVFSSPTSGMMRGEIKGRSFWMKVDCELIVYGATEPDAAVSVQGRRIRLRPDGTFTLRFALPDGKQDIDVKGVSADGVDERVITPTVARKTFYEEKTTCTKDI